MRFENCQFELKLTDLNEIIPWQMLLHKRCSCHKNFFVRKDYHHKLSQKSVLHRIWQVRSSVPHAEVWAISAFFPASVSFGFSDEHLSLQTRAKTKFFFQLHYLTGSLFRVHKFGTNLAELTITISLPTKNIKTAPFDIHKRSNNSARTKKSYPH